MGTITSSDRINIHPLYKTPYILKPNPEILPKLRPSRHQSKTLDLVVRTWMLWKENLTFWPMILPWQQQNLQSKPLWTKQLFLTPSTLHKQQVMYYHHDYKNTDFSN